MKGQWYTINIYPESKDGFFTVVVLENEGYRVPCRKHRDKPACAICDRMHKAHLLRARFDMPADEGFDEVDELVRAAFRAWISGAHSKKDAHLYKRYNS